MNAIGPYWWLVIGSGNGLVPSGNKPLSESQCWPRSLSPYDVIGPQWVNDVTWLTLRLKSPGTRLLAEQFYLFKLTSKETSNVHITNTLRWKFADDRWFPITKGQSCGKHFHVITSLSHWGQIQGVSGICLISILTKIITYTVTSCLANTSFWSRIN